MAKGKKQTRGVPAKAANVGKANDAAADMAALKKKPPQPRSAGRRGR